MNGVRDCYSIKEMPYSVAGFGLVCCLLFGAGLVPAQELSTGQKRQDLQFVLNELPRRHPNLFSVTPRAEFEAAGRALDAAAGSLSNVEFYTRLSALVALGKDAHTGLGLNGGAAQSLGFAVLPVAFQDFEDGMYVIAATGQFAYLQQARLLRIGEFSIEEAVERARSVVPYGNEGWFRFLVPGYLRNVGVLRGVGLAPASGPVAMTFQLAAGELRVVELEAGIEPVSRAVSTASGFAPVLLRRLGENYWAEYWEDTRTIYVAYRVCAEMPNRTIAQFQQEIRALAQRPVETMVFDLRGNTGGNSIFFSTLWGNLQTTIIEKLRGSRSFRIYALIDRGTFSSGLLALYDLKRPFFVGIGLGPEDGSPVVTSVGEATGGRPGTYGEVLSLTLPVSQLSLFHSTRLMTIPSFIPPGLAVAPDVGVATRATDYFARHDSVLAAVLTRRGVVRDRISGEVAVVNAASFRVETGIVPGSFAAAFGNFAGGLGEVFVNGVAARVVGGNTEQVVFRVPESTALGRAEIQAGGARGQFDVGSAGPGIFVTNPGNPEQPAAVLNQDSTLNVAGRRARAGEVLQIFGTGFVDGVGVQVWIGQRPAEVVFSGYAPGVLGLWQLNARVPGDLGVSGVVPVFVSAGVGNGVRVSNGGSVWVE